MEDHGRKRSRGSLSFSFEALRSFSRTGTREKSSQPYSEIKSSRIDSLKSRPEDPLLKPLQPTLVPGPGRRQRSNTTELGGTTPGIASTNKIPSSFDKALPSTPPARNAALSQKPRPLSWFSGSLFHSNGGIGKFHPGLPKHASSSTVTPSIISGPVLTSTTNADVARAQGVRCGELANNDFVQSTCDPRQGRGLDRPQVQKETTSATEAHKLENILEGAIQEMSEEESKERQRTKMSTALFAKHEADENRKSRRKGYRRAGSNTTVARLKDAVADRLKISHPSEKFVLLEEDSTTPPIDERVARRKAEGLNLSKEKIRTLTGCGNIRRKPVHGGDESSRTSNVKGRGDEVCNAAAESNAEQASSSRCLERSDISFGFGLGDMETSFLDAVDKLDLQDICTKEKHGQAIHSLQRSSRTPEEQEVHARNMTNLPKTPTPRTTTTTTNKATANQRHSVASDLYQKRGNAAAVHTPTRSALHSSPAEPAVLVDFSVGQAGGPPLTSAAKRNTLTPNWQAGLRQDGRINPLGCHPNVMEFASPPVDTIGVSPTSGGISTPLIKITRHNDADHDELEDAPIFCPSSGNLSQYARLTCSSARSTSPFNGLSPGNLLERSRHLAIFDTPTRVARRDVMSDDAQGGHLARMAKSNNRHVFQETKHQVTPARVNERGVVDNNKADNVGDTGDLALQEENRSPSTDGSTVSMSTSHQFEDKRHDEHMAGNDLSPYRVGGSNRIVAWR